MAQKQVPCSEWRISETTRLFMPLFAEKPSVDGKTFDKEALLKNVATDASELKNWPVLKQANDSLIHAVNESDVLLQLAGFVKSDRWTKATLSISTNALFELYLDGNKIKTRENVAENPVKAEFSAGEKAGFKNGQRLFFATGPYAGYLLNAKAIKDDVTVDLDTYNDFDFGWSFELGYKIPVNKSNALQISLNYDMGISEVADDTDSENKSASLNVAWLF